MDRLGCISALRPNLHLNDLRLSVWKVVSIIVLNVNKCLFSFYPAAVDTRLEFVRGMASPEPWLRLRSGVFSAVSGRDLC